MENTIRYRSTKEAAAAVLQAPAGAKANHARGRRQHVVDPL